MILYGLKTCDTCRKALKTFPAATFVDVRGEGVPAQTLTDAFDRFGAALVNTRSATWRELSPADRARAPLELLAEHPVLMKRPLITHGDQMWLGWAPETRTALGVG